MGKDKEEEDHGNGVCEWTVDRGQRASSPSSNNRAELVQKLTGESTYRACDWEQPENRTSQID